MLVDVSKCIACRSCQVACKQWWKLPAVPSVNRGTHENPPDLTAYTWNRIGLREIESDGTKKSLFTRKACMHCNQAVCVWVCPSYARGYDDLGYVTLNRERCIGCGRCEEYCPFEVPKLGPHDISARISVKLNTPRFVSYSCVLCRDRVENGDLPACAKSCPTQAMQFGELSDLAERGQARVNIIRGRHPKANLYGRKELGGLKVLYILTEEPSAHGFPEKAQLGTYPPFITHTFPHWYEKALADGLLPAFPQQAKSHWYMQPDLVPVPPPEEPAWTWALSGPRLGRWAPVLWGWLGRGFLGAIAGILLRLRRRTSSEGDRERDKET